MGVNHPRQHRRSSGAGRAVLILGLLFLCLLVTAALTAVNLVPDLAADRFGSASPDLTLNQRLMYSARLLLNQEALLEPLQPDAGPVEFDIDSGEAPPQVSQRLEAAGLIGDARVFRDYLVYTGIDRRIQAGRYPLSAAMTAVEIASQLQDPSPEDVTLLVLPGWRAEEIATAFQVSGLATSQDEFMHWVNNYPAEWLPADWPVVSRVEGLLAPGEYTFPRTSSTPELVREMVGRSAQVITADLFDSFESRGLSFFEALTLASIVQKEGVVEEERPMIASVFYNRLEAGMRLESDPTVQYAAGYQSEQQTWWTNPITQADLQLDSAYNTYVYPGLPPGPICNPSLSALQAVANPAQSPYYYFRALCDESGRHAFSTTYQEHLEAACE